MSTQEREAMERLARIRNGEPEIDVHGIRTPALAPFRTDQDREAVISAALSRHARSLQPITVEGLESIGFEDDSRDSDWSACQYGRIRVERYRSGTWHWAILGSGIIPDAVKPQTMLDVDNLIERLSR